ncbi:MAG: MarR family transcriptional regulator [Acidobacteriota bacterium]
MSTSYRSWLLSPLHRANRQTSLHMERQVEELGLSATEGHVLSYVHRYGPCRISELVRVFGIKQSTVTSLIDRLEGRDLLRRQLNPDDRRSFLISTTPEGDTLVTEAGTYLEAFERAVDERLEPAEREAFEKVLAAIDELTEIDVRSNEATTPEEKR